MGKELAIGDQAPELGIPDQDGRVVTLQQFRGKQVVLYFYPKDDTPGCTKESCDFRDTEAQIMRAGGTIIGVSLDSQESHQKFIKKFGLPFRYSVTKTRACPRPTGCTSRKTCTEKNIGASNGVRSLLTLREGSRPFFAR